MEEGTRKSGRTCGRASAPRGASALYIIVQARQWGVFSAPRGPVPALLSRSGTGRRDPRGSPALLIVSPTSGERPAARERDRLGRGLGPGRSRPGSPSRYRVAVVQNRSVS